MKVLYTSKVTTIGGREGTTRSENGVLNLKLTIPKELAGPGGPYTNPEQLFAAGYSACFDSALRHTARQQKTSLKDSQVTAEVSIGSNESGGFALAVLLRVRLTGMERSAAESLVAAAHQTCPYSNATRNNIPVEIVLED